MLSNSVDYQQYFCPLPKGWLDSHKKGKTFFEMHRLIWNVKTSWNFFPCEDALISRFFLGDAAAADTFGLVPRD